MNKTQRGFSMMEVLVSLVIITFGLLGMVRLQQRTIVAEMESYQRTQALILMQDIAERMNANRKAASTYVQNDIGVGSVQTCTGITNTKDLDICEWGNLLRGTTETTGTGAASGAMIGARGCITSPAANTYIIAVAWQGMVESAVPINTCGQNQYGTTDGWRRVVTTTVQMATLGL